MQSRISMITLGVCDLQQSIQFYEQGLRLSRFSWPADEVAFFDLAGSWLGLYGRDALAEDIGRSSQGSGFSGFTLAHNVASPAEVEEVLQQAVTAGAKLIKPGQEVYWGGYVGYFGDPDGHIWEVAHNPHFWVGPAVKA